MDFPVFVAKRYLFAKKTHNVINIISYISIIGVAIGTFALIVTLSIANGYDELTRSMYSAFNPDLRITAVEGKTFIPDSAILKKISGVNGVSGYSKTIEENVLISYKSNESQTQTATQNIAIMKGVDENFTKISGITKPYRKNNSYYSYTILGKFELWNNNIPQTVLGLGIFQTLNVNLNNLTPIQVWIPKRGAKVSITSPMDAMSVDYIYPSGVFSIEQSFDNNYFFVPIEFAQNILDYKDKISAIEIITDSTANIKNIQKQVSKIVGNNFSVKSRYQQNETLYKMLSSEKYAIYMILAFIITLFSFNIIGSISMLIVDKKKDIHTFKTLGANEKTIKQIFFYEGCMIAMGGAITGLILGILFCLAQQYFKILKLPNTFIIDAYPVKIELGDIFLILAFVVVVGYTMARLPIWYLSKKMKAI